MTEKRFPFKRAAVFFCIAIPMLGWITNARRAERLEKKLLEYEPPHKLPPCWTERIEAEDPQPKHRE